MIKATVSISGTARAMMNFVCTFRSMKSISSMTFIVLVSVATKRFIVLLIIRGRLVNPRTLTFIGRLVVTWVTTVLSVVLQARTPLFPCTVILSLTVLCLPQ